MEKDLQVGVETEWVSIRFWKLEDSWCWFNMRVREWTVHHLANKVNDRLLRWSDGKNHWYIKETYVEENLECKIRLYSLLSFIQVFTGHLTMGQRLWEAAQTQWSSGIITVITLLPVYAAEDPLTASYKSEWVRSIQDAHRILWGSKFYLCQKPSRMMGNL